jgi:CubicO group peptidase (beta-lactamase class C family)
MSHEVLEVPIETELDARFGAYIAAEQAPGIVYGITDGSGLQHSRGFGRRASGADAPDLDTVFPIASMSKSFCACAALIARDRGLLSLNDPIDRYMPEFTLAAGGPEPDGVPTVGMLLSMCGGLTEDNSWIDPFIGMPTSELLAMVEAGGLKLSRLPGTVYEYSNLGYQMGCLAVSRAVGKPIMDFIAEEILAPLGMTNTYPDTVVPGSVTRAAGHKLDVDGNWVAFPPVSSDAYAGACGINSCVRDLARWITWLGAAHRPDNGEGELVLSRMSRREMQRMHIPADPALSAGPGSELHIGTSGYALGLMVDHNLRFGTFVSHAGGLPGFLLYMRWHPESGNGIVMLSNSHRGNPIGLAVGALSDVLARKSTPAQTVTPWPETLALRERTEALIRDWDDAVAAEIFAGNVDFDRAVSERRREIADLVAAIGPLKPAPEHPEIVSVVTPADITWAIPAENGELLVMIHLTPVDPAQIQEIEVTSVQRTQPRAARPIDISERRRDWGDAVITSMTNTALKF